MNILEQNNATKKLKNLIRNFSLMILCYFLFFFVLELLNLYVFNLDMEKYQQTELFELLNENPWKFAFLAGIAAPILEEGIFRSLLKPSASSIKVFICTVLYVVGIAFIPEEAHWTLKYGLLATTILFAYYAMGELISEKIFRIICFWLHRNYLVVWIAGAIIFGFVHIFNYVDTFKIDLVLFLMIVPRIIAGFFFGKIKLENRSLIWPMLMHSMNNSLVLLFFLPFTLSN